jgi:hypothetical protein
VRALSREILRPVLLVALGAIWAFSALMPVNALAAPTILSREEEAQAKALEAERETLVQRIYRERLLQVPPETFHSGRANAKRPVLDVVEDLLFLDLAARILETGGVENVDRLREAAQVWRNRSARNATRSREVLSDRLHPSQDELVEAGRTGLSLVDVIARDDEKPAAAIAAVPGAAPMSAAPLDYIPVPPEDLAALRERYLASGRSVDEAWYSQLARDPIAEQRWKEQQRATELHVARLQTAWATDKGLSYQTGTWLQETWQRKDPVGLAIVAVLLLALGVVVLVALKLLRRDQ